LCYVYRGLHPNLLKTTTESQMIRSYRFYIVVLLCLLQACKKAGNTQSAFYYWKSTFSLDSGRSEILKKVAGSKLYVRFFDVRWDDHTHRAFPDAVITFKQPVSNLHITPVIFITNKTFENIKDSGVDSLALNCNALIGRISLKEKISSSNIQVDCDWTTATRNKYFNFLKTLKKISHRRLEVTIRLHQVKYKEKTGIPPADKGVLMFYNMGKVDAAPGEPNSIYNEADAAKYVSFVSQYPLPLDVALPLFSWSVHIREGRVIQLYGQIGKKQLDNAANFDGNNHIYHAKKSFFMDGIYVKENDIFKLEQIDSETLKKAAEQLSRYLPQQKNRTIIYYELANLDLSEFNAQSLDEVSAHL
jgi:hypothetical protein